MKLCPSCMKQIEDYADTCPYCGYEDFTTWQISFFLPPGTILNNRYYVGKSLGHGGFGITYIGKDMVLDRIVAIKEYYPTGLVTRDTDSSAVQSYPGEFGEQFYAGLEKFIAEAKRLAEFGGGRGIVQIHDCIRANNTGYIIMELLRGHTIRDMVKSGKKYTFAEASQILTPVLDALDFVHSHGIIHRDIAPDNIFITDDGAIRLIDFGAAYYVEKNADKTVSVVLKHGYAPEEQYKTHPHLGPWTDIYGLSATLYYMLTQKKPVSSIERIPDDVLKPPSEWNDSITQEQDNVILKGMAIRAEDRYQSAAEMKTAILNCPAAENEPGAGISKPINPPAPSTKRGGKGKLITVITVVIFMVVVGANIFFTGRNLPWHNSTGSSLEEEISQTPENEAAMEENADEQKKNTSNIEKTVEYTVTHVHADGTTDTDEGTVANGARHTLNPSPGGQEEYAAVSLISGQPTVTIDDSTGEAVIEGDSTFSPVRLTYYYQDDSDASDNEKSSARLGMILAASESMSYTFDTPEPIKVDESYPVDQTLTDEQVAGILNIESTDNYALGYSNYRYYVDSMDGTNQFSPLAYWDGNTGTTLHLFDMTVTQILTDTNYTMGVLEAETQSEPGWYFIKSPRTLEVFETLSVSKTITGYGRAEFYIDDDRHLCCSFQRSLTGEDRTSYVYERTEQNPTRIEVLQDLVSELVLSAERHFAEPQFSLTRFSRNSFEDDRLLMTSWTINPAEAINALNRTYSEGTNAGEEQEDGTALYNYGLTSGASSRTAFRSFLQLQGPQTNADQERVIILVADGADTDNLGNEKDDSCLSANEYVQKLKDEGYTIVTVLLLGDTGLAEDAETWLSSCASKDSNNEPLYFRLDSSDRVSVAALADEIMGTLQS